MTHKTLRLTLPFVMLAAIACKPDEPAATAGYQQGAPGGAGGPATGPIVPAPSASAVPTASTPAPVPTTPPPLDPAVAAAVTPMLTQLGASQTVAGSKPLGTAMIGNVGGAQVLEQQIMLQPNKCYSVVAAGMPPISELNVQFLAVTVIAGHGADFGDRSGRRPERDAGQEAELLQVGVALADPGEGRGQCSGRPRRRRRTSLREVNAFGARLRAAPLAHVRVRHTPRRVTAQPSAS